MGKPIVCGKSDPNVSGQSVLDPRVANDLVGKFKALAALRALAEPCINALRIAGALACCTAQIGLANGIADANIHGRLLSRTGLLLRIDRNSKQDRAQSNGRASVGNSQATDAGS